MVTAAEIKTVFSKLSYDHTPTMLEELGTYSPFQKLIMTMLSARTRDSTVIPLVKKLFLLYPTPQAFLNVKKEEIEKKIYGVGFYKVKAQNIQKISKIILEKFQGKVPQTIEELTSLPGVGNKTANCVLAYAFNIPAIAVDTHVHRISNRLGWIKTSHPSKTEEVLKKIVPKDQWRDVNSLLVSHGQRICLPIKPKCEICPIATFCLFGQKKLGLKK